MKQYAVVTDTISNTQFGVIVRENNLETCYGFTAKGRAWADGYNNMQTKSLDQELPYGVLVGDFRGMASFEEPLIKELHEGRPARLLDRSVATHCKSSKIPHLEDSPNVARQRLDMFRGTPAFQVAVDYKAQSFRVDSAKFSVLAKKRIGKYGLNHKGLHFKSRNADDHAVDSLSEVAQGAGNLRRFTIDFYQVKESKLEGHRGFDVKKLGGRIGGGLRAAPSGMSFVDITGRVDADGDGIVFEGLPLERPIIPRFLVPKNLARRMSAAVDGDSLEIEKARREGNTTAQMNESRLQELLGEDFNNVRSADGQKLRGLRSERDRATPPRAAERKPAQARRAEQPDSAPEGGGKFRSERDLSRSEINDAFFSLDAEQRYEILALPPEDRRAALSEVLEEIKNFEKGTPEDFFKMGREQRRDYVRRRNNANRFGERQNSRQTARDAADDVTAERSMGSGPRRGGLESRRRAIPGMEVWDSLSDEDKEDIRVSSKKQLAELAKRLLTNDPDLAAQLGFRDTLKEDWDSVGLGTDPNPTSHNYLWTSSLNLTGAERKLNNLWKTIDDSKWGTGIRKGTRHLHTIERLQAELTTQKTDGKLSDELFEEYQAILNDMSKFLRAKINGYKNVDLEGLSETSIKEVWERVDGERIKNNKPSLPSPESINLTSKWDPTAELSDITEELAKAKKPTKRVRFLDRIVLGQEDRNAKKARKKARRSGATTEAPQGRTAAERAKESLRRSRRRVISAFTNRELTKQVNQLRDVNEKNKLVQRNREGAFVLHPDADVKLHDVLVGMADPARAAASLTSVGVDTRNGENDISHNPFMALSWDANGFNARPMLVTERDLVNLANKGHRGISRGFGADKKFSDSYLFDEKRYLPGASGGEAQGPGEYWMDAGKPGSWESYLSSSGANVIGILPSTARVANRSDLKKQQAINKKFIEAYRLAAASVSDQGGWELVNATDAATVLRAEFDKLSSSDRASEIGRFWLGMVDIAERKGDTKGLASLAVIAKMSDRSGRGSHSDEDAANLLAPLLGYDAIRVDADLGRAGAIADYNDGRVLIMNRAAVIALDKSVSAAKAKEHNINMNKADAGETLEVPDVPKTPKKPSKKPVNGIDQQRADNFIKNGPSNIPDSEADILATMEPWAAGPRGSNPIFWYKNDNGKKVVVKPGKSVEHANNETAVNVIYHLYGVGPEAKVMDHQGTTSAVLEGLPITSVGGMDAKTTEELRKHMGLDMLLANWDIKTDNLGRLPNGAIVRVDAGGGGKFRAKGDRKDPAWDDSNPFGELASMLAPKSFGAEAFKPETLTNRHMRDALTQVVSMNPSTIAAALRAAGVDAETIKAFTDTIKHRQTQARALLGQFEASDLSKIVEVVFLGNGDPGNHIKPGV